MRFQLSSFALLLFLCVALCGTVQAQLPIHTWQIQDSGVLIVNTNHGNASTILSVTPNQPSVLLESGERVFLQVASDFVGSASYYKAKGGHPARFGRSSNPLELPYSLIVKTKEVAGSVIGNASSESDLIYYSQIHASLEGYDPTINVIIDLDTGSPITLEVGASVTIRRLQIGTTPFKELWHQGDDKVFHYDTVYTLYRVAESVLKIYYDNPELHVLDSNVFDPTLSVDKDVGIESGSPTEHVGGTDGSKPQIRTSSTNRYVILQWEDSIAANSITDGTYSNIDLDFYINTITDAGSVTAYMLKDFDFADAGSTAEPPSTGQGYPVWTHKNYNGTTWASGDFSKSDYVHGDPLGSVAMSANATNTITLDSVGVLNGRLSIILIPSGASINANYTPKEGGRFATLDFPSYETFDVDFVTTHSELVGAESFDFPIHLSNNDAFPNALASDLNNLVTVTFSHIRTATETIAHIIKNAVDQSSGAIYIVSVSTPTVYGDGLFATEIKRSTRDDIINYYSFPVNLISAGGGGDEGGSGGVDVSAKLDSMHSELSLAASGVNSATLDLNDLQYQLGIVRAGQQSATQAIDVIKSVLNGVPTDQARWVSGTMAITSAAQNTAVAFTGYAATAWNPTRTGAEVNLANTNSVAYNQQSHSLNTPGVSDSGIRFGTDAKLGSQKLNLQVIMEATRTTGIYNVKAYHFVNGVTYEHELGHIVHQATQSTNISDSDKASIVEAATLGLQPVDGFSWKLLSEISPSDVTQKGSASNFAASSGLQIVSVMRFVNQSGSYENRWKLHPYNIGSSIPADMIDIPTAGIDGLPIDSLLDLILAVPALSGKIEQASPSWFN